MGLSCLLYGIADQPSQMKKIMPVKVSQPCNSKCRSNPHGWSAKKSARIAQAAENGVILCYFNINGTK
jgi:hypothetical protein